MLWTPAVLVMDAGGKERARIEGYLPREEFRAQLELALARVAFTGKRWDEAERQYGEVARQFPSSTVAAEAVYWEGVSYYKKTGDHTGLGPLAKRLAREYPGTVWTIKASVWAPAEAERAA